MYAVIYVRIKYSYLISLVNTQIDDGKSQSVIMLDIKVTVLVI